MENGHATGNVRWILQAEGAAIAALAVAFYAAGGFDWWYFALLFLAPDLAMAGYALGARFGAWAYNIAHSYTAPVLLAACGWALGSWAETVPLALIWVAHIGADRAIGYGLKYPAGFKVTHLSAPNFPPV